MTKKNKKNTRIDEAHWIGEFLDLCHRFESQTQTELSIIYGTKTEINTFGSLGKRIKKNSVLMNVNTLKKKKERKERKRKEKRKKEKGKRKRKEKKERQKTKEKSNIQNITAY